MGSSARNRRARSEDEKCLQDGLNAAWSKVATSTGETPPTCSSETGPIGASKFGVFERDSRNKPGLRYTYETVPTYLHRAFIFKYYRAHLSSFQCVKSLFRLHNELFDCWSHLLAALFLWTMAIYLPIYEVPHNPFPIMLFCCSHAFVYSASGFAHTMNCMSEKTHLFCFQLDWSAIAFSMLGFGVSLVCYIFHCDSAKATTNSILISVPCILLFLVANTQLFQAQDSSIKGLFAVSPVPAFAYVAYDASQHIVDFHEFTSCMQLPVLISLVGIIIYASKVPERWFPGKFDLLFHSHNFHHMWSTAFSLLVLKNLLYWSRLRNDQQCPT